MKWEYIISRMKATKELQESFGSIEDWDHEIQAWLNHMGDDGWELVKWSSGPSFQCTGIFKRPSQ